MRDNAVYGDFENLEAGWKHEDLSSWGVEIEEVFTECKSLILFPLYCLEHVQILVKFANAKALIALLYNVALASVLLRAIKRNQLLEFYSVDSDDSHNAIYGEFEDIGTD